MSKLAELKKIKKEAAKEVLADKSLSNVEKLLQLTENGTYLVRSLLLIFYLDPLIKFQHIFHVK